MRNLLSAVSSLKLIEEMKCFADRDFANTDFQWLEVKSCLVANSKDEVMFDVYCLCVTADLTANQKNGARTELKSPCSLQTLNFQSINLRSAKWTPSSN